MLVISFISMFYLGLICLRVNDMKMLIAYSSVSHIALSLGGLFTLLSSGYIGRVFMLLGHGVCSSGLFSTINMCYERSGRRRIYVNKGLFSISLGFTILTFMLCIINMSAPPTINLFSEILLIVSSIKFRLLSSGALFLGSFTVTCYRIFFFSHILHGKSFHSVINFTPISVNEFNTLVSHILPLLLSFIFMNFMSL